MKNILKISLNILRGLAGAFVFLMVFGLSLYLCEPKDHRKQNQIVSTVIEKSNPYYEIPFRIVTTKGEFDSLGVQFIFSTDSIQQWKDTSEKTFFQSLWVPKRFAVYDDGYFIWEGNRTCVFLSQKQQHPTCKFLLIGKKCGNIFSAKEMYIVF